MESAKGKKQNANFTGLLLPEIQESKKPKKINRKQKLQKKSKRQKKKKERRK